MLGERIRKIRKQKKMTLEALAGTELTKGMLSLIENNKANPSMESLTYIANQLEVELSDLLDTISSDELRTILEAAEKIYNNDHEDKFKELIELIEPHVKNLSQGYESARLLEIYSYSLHRLRKDGWLEAADRAATIFDQMNLTGNRTAISIFRAKRKFIERDYQGALELFLNERHDIEANHAFIDPMTRLDLDYHQAVMYFAVGDSDSATRAMESAIQFSKEKRIFYLIDDLYRLAAAHAMLSQNHEKKQEYLEKLKQYGEFADHIPSLLFCKLINVISLVSDEGEYEKAIEIIDQEQSGIECKDSLEPWFMLEKGKALYHLGRLEESLYYFEKVEIPAGIHHPFDLSIFYVMDAYKALIHFRYGDIKEAKKLAERIMKNFSPLSDSPFKRFSLEACHIINRSEQS